jgi:hypothetical protein
MSHMARSAGDATRRLLHLPPDVRELVDSMPDVFYRVDREDRLVVISRSSPPSTSAAS